MQLPKVYEFDVKEQQSLLQEQSKQTWKLDQISDHKAIFLEIGHPTTKEHDIPQNQNPHNWHIPEENMLVEQKPISEEELVDMEKHMQEEQKVIDVNLNNNRKRKEELQIELERILQEQIVNSEEERVLQQQKKKLRLRQKDLLQLRDQLRIKQEEEQKRKQKKSKNKKKKQNKKKK